MSASIVRVVAGAMRGAPEKTTGAPVTIEALFSAYVAFVWRSLRHFGVAEADLDDQTQEVFMVVHRRLGECEGDPRAWLYAIARRCAAAYRRRSHRRHECLVDTTPESSDTTDPATRMEVERLNRVLESLDENKRTVLLLYEVEQMTMREVAELVNCPLPTAYARLYAARRELARSLEELEAT
jgi:RNA polymerase sigma-70 factor, ECF subfamily